MIEPRFDLDHELAMSSLDRIVDLEADLLLPGHGDPWAEAPPRPSPWSAASGRQIRQRQRLRIVRQRNMSEDRGASLGGIASRLTSGTEKAGARWHHLDD